MKPAWTIGIAVALLVPLWHRTHAASKAPGGYTGKVVKVLDGDTFFVERTNQADKIRLLHVDCPERNQPFGAEAKAFTEDFTADRDVLVQPAKRKSYDRVLAVVSVLKKDGARAEGLAEALLHEGLAWVDTRYSRDKELLALQAEATKAKRGLCKDSKPIPPWEWRKGKR